MARPDSFFAYARLKILIVLLRFALLVQGYIPLRRDSLVANKVPGRRERIRIPSRDPGRYIAADLYYPLSSHSPVGSTSAVAKRPVLVNWHGSGWVFPLLGSDELFCKRVACELDVFVLDADYRKAPETPFPGPLNDVEDTLRWVASQSLIPGFDASLVAVSGFSAGAELALVAATKLRKSLAWLPLDINAAVAFYPETDLSIPPEEKTVPRPIQPHSPFAAHLFHDCYVPDKNMRTDPAVSPSKADPADFPPAVVMLTCDGDPLSPEALELAQKLDDGKRKVVAKNLANVHHGFDKGAKEGTNDWERRDEAYQTAISALREAWKL